MAGNPLDLRLRSLIRRTRVLTIVQIAGRGLAGCGAILLLAAWLDYGLRLEDRGVRTFLSIGAAAAIGWLLRDALVQYRQLSFDRLTFARELERRFPTLRGLLASAVEFGMSREEGLASGSPALRKAVIDRAARVAEPIDFAVALNHRPVVRALALAILVAVAVTVSVNASPSTAVLSATRLVLPWSDASWPRRHQLELVATGTSVARGQPLALTITDHQGRLPSDLTLLVATDGERNWREITPQVTEDRLRATVEFDSVASSMRVRARGGDDDTMPWLSISVVAAPVVEWQSVTVVPPDYLTATTSQSPTNSPATSPATVPAATATPLVQPIRAVAGSRVALRGRVDRPIQSAVARLVGKPESGDIRLAIREGASEFELAPDAVHPWILRESGTYVIELRDQEGVPSEVARWIIEVTEDEPPTVSLALPRPNAYAVPEARLNVRGIARDDHGIERLEIQVASGSAPIPLRLMIAADGDASLPATSSLVRAEFNGTWSLSSDDDIAPGGVLEYKVVAWDRKPQRGESSLQRLEIVTRDEFERRSSQREASLLEQLREALNAQRRARQQLREVNLGDAESRRAAQQLQSLDLTQRSVLKLLADDQAGVSVATRELLDDLTQNQFLDGPVVERLNSLWQSLAPLVDERLPRIERLLAQALRLVDESPSEATVALQSAGPRLDDVQAELERLVDLLAPWDRLRQQTLELGDIRQHLANLLERTEQMLVEDPSPDADGSERAQRQVAVLRQMAEEQWELGRRIDRAVSTLRATRQEIPPDSSIATTLDAALDLANESAISGQLREAGRATRDGRIGAAIEKQQNALDDLGHILDTLSSRVSTPSPGSSGDRGAAAQRAREEWREAVELLVRQQDALVARLSPDSPDDASRRPLSGEQRARWSADQGETARQAEDHLARLPPIASFQLVLRGAVERMRQAIRRLESEDAARAVDAADAARRRLELLQRALTELSESPTGEADAPPPETQSTDSAPAPQSPDRPTSEQTWAEWSLLRELQAELLSRTEALDRTRDARGELDAEGQQELERLAREQMQLVELLKGMLP